MSKTDAMPVLSLIFTDLAGTEHNNFCSGMDTVRRSRVHVAWQKKFEVERDMNKDIEHSEAIAAVR